MTFGRAIDEMRSGKRMTRTAWFSTYYVYLDSRLPNQFTLVYDRPFFIDSDLLANDWKEWVDPLKHRE